jgi:hypothetical protein
LGSVGGECEVIALGSNPVSVGENAFKAEWDWKLCLSRAEQKDGLEVRVAASFDTADEDFIEFRGYEGEGYLGEG